MKHNVIDMAEAFAEVERDALANDAKREASGENVRTMQRLVRRARAENARLRAHGCINEEE
jgi:hypothetical protein